jgi:hypothetical protein
MIASHFIRSGARIFPNRRGDRRLPPWPAIRPMRGCRTCRGRPISCGSAWVRTAYCLDLRRTRPRGRARRSQGAARGRRHARSASCRSSGAARHLTRASILAAKTIIITITGQKKRDLLEQAIEDGHSSKLRSGGCSPNAISRLIFTGVPSAARPAHLRSHGPHHRAVRPGRQRYLALVARKRSGGSSGPRLSCGNFAHGFAAAGEDKATIRSMRAPEHRHRHRLQ